VESVRNALLAGAAAIAVSPLLAAWCDNLIHNQRTGWWRPHRVTFRRWSAVAVVALSFTAAASHGTPAVAWWCFAVTGAVLAIVDTKTHRLPARLVGSLAAAEAATLAIESIALDRLQPLVRAGAAAVAVTAAYLLVAIMSPRAIGLGDIYLMGIASGLLAWTSWGAVIVGQIAIWTLGMLLGFVTVTLRSDGLRWNTPIPMGPALVGGVLAAAYAGVVR
jgi:leader peptidase (prepilin peptidase)/N-methyltransferase